MKFTFIKKQKSWTMLCVLLLIAVCLTIGTALAKYISTLEIGSFDLSVKAIKRAYIVYSADDNSLEIFKGLDIPKVGEKSRTGKTVSKVYHDRIEFTHYTFKLSGGQITSDSVIPAWHEISSRVKKVNFVDTVSPLSTSGWFYGFSQVTSFDLSKLDTSKTIDMSGMFRDCKMTAIDLSGLDTSKNEKLSSMFFNCNKLTDINFGENFDTSKVSSFGDMFSGCSSLKTVDLSSFTTESATYLGWMFTNCTSLTVLDLSTFKIPNTVTSMDGMFWNCSRLTTVYASDDFVTTGVTSSTNMFYSCRNLVGGNGTKLSTTGNKIDKTFARIDGLNGLEGYFTCKHNINSWADNSDGTHSGACSICGKVLSENCNFNIKNNEDATHSKVCTECGYAINEDCYSDNITDNEDGTITFTCDVCRAEVTKENSDTLDLLEKEEFSTIDFDFDDIDDTNLEWKPLSDHEDMMPYPNEDYQIEFKANEGYKLPDTIKVEIDGTVYNVATNGENAEGEPTFANGILTIPAELLTDETKSLVITVSAISVDEQTEEEKPTDEEKTDEEQKPTEETDEKKDETETDKSEDTSNGDTNTGGDTSEEIKKEFNIDTTDLENAEIKCTFGDDGNAELVIKANKGYTLPETFIISIGGTEYEIDTTTAEQDDGIVWDSETGTLTIPKDLVSGENVEIGIKLQAIIKEDDEEEADKKPEEDKNPDGDDSTEDTDDTTSGGTEGEKPKDETAEDGTGTDDTTQGGNENVGGSTDTENDETTENGGTENGEQKPSDNTTETPGEDAETDTPVVPPVTDGEQTGGTDDEANGDDSTEEGGEENGGDNVPPVTEETPAQPPVTENDGTEENGGETGGEDTKPVVPSDKAETPGEDTSSGSTETGGTDDTASGGTESGNDTPQGDTSASGNNNSTGESTDTSGSTTDNTPAAPPASESTNNSVATPTAPSTSTGTQGGDSSQGNSQGSGATGGTSGGDGNSSSNASTTSATTNTTAKKKTETTGSTGGDDSGDSN